MPITIKKEIPIPKGVRPYTPEYGDEGWRTDKETGPVCVNMGCYYIVQAGLPNRIEIFTNRDTALAQLDITESGYLPLGRDEIIEIITLDIDEFTKLMPG